MYQDGENTGKLVKLDLTVGYSPLASQHNVGPSLLLVKEQHVINLDQLMSTMLSEDCSSKPFLDLFSLYLLL